MQSRARRVEHVSDVGYNERAVYAHRHENVAAALRQEVGEECVQATDEGGDVSNLDEEAKLEEGFRWADDQHQKVEHRQVEEEAERGALPHAPPSEHNNIAHVSEQADDDHNQMKPEYKVKRVGEGHGLCVIFF